MMNKKRKEREGEKNREIMNESGTKRKKYVEEMNKKMK